MRFGADYYPEHWPEERWETDARLMQEAGFNITRLAEFAWTKMEPQEGKFEFDWLLRAMDILHNHGIQSVIGTPTPTPPAWLCHSRPEILKVDEYKRKTEFGNRQQSCINQPAYMAASDIIVTELAKAVSNHEGLYGWQIDNEFGPLCYCDLCQRLFQDWLREKYKTLESLEDAWGTIFWSQTYSDWRQIPLPWATGNAPNPSLALDYRRFFSDCYAKFQQRQINIIRKFSDKPITHNFMGIWPEVLNYQQLADQLDFASWDNYPMGGADPARTSAAHDIVRGYLRKNFWVMEQMSGPGGWGEMAPAPKPGRIREWTYHAIGRGADAINYFRWRVCRSGTEQYWHGILNHDGSTNRRYEEIKQTREEVSKFENLLHGTSVNAQVAFINDYDSRFAFQYQKSNWAMDYVEVLTRFYRGLYEKNIGIDILSADHELSKYKLLVAPALFVLTEKRAKRFEQYVRNGGTLVLTFRSAVKNKTGLIFNEPLPGLLQSVFGATVKEYHSPAQTETNMIKGIYGKIDGKTGECGTWLDLMQLNTAEAIAEYSDGFIPNEVAVTRNEVGEGKAYYIGTLPSVDFAKSLMQMIAKDAGVEFGIETPEGVDACVRSGESGNLIFLTNHTNQQKLISLPEAKEELVTGNKASKSVELGPYGVAVLK